MRSEVSWSYLSPRPMFFKNEEYDAHICFWNGIAMTRSYALIITGLVWNNIYPSQSMRTVAWDEFVKVYSLGVFEDYKWDNYVSTFKPSHHNYLMQLIGKNNPKILTDLAANYSPQTAFSWFLSDKEFILTKREQHEPTF